MRTAGVLAAVAVSFVSLHARADNAKAWSAAKAGLPADAKIVIAIDLAGLQKTQVFPTLWPMLLDKAGATKAFEMMKDLCKIDPLVNVQGVIYAVTADQKEGAGYVALSGIDKVKLSSCLQQSIQSLDKSTKVSVKHDGNITEVSDGKSSLFLGWVSKDVVVVPHGEQTQAALVKWMSGKGAFAKTALGKAIAKVNTSAALWGVGEGSNEVEPGLVVKGVYGALSFAKGNLDTNVHATMESAAQATTMAGVMNKKLDEVRKGPLLPATIGTVLKAVTIATANDEVVLKANVPEKDVLSALTMVLAGGGGH